MSSVSPIFFPHERAKLAKVLPRGEGETDSQWLARAVLAKTAVVMTSADARNLPVYRRKIADAAASNAHLVVVQDDAQDTRLHMNEGAGTPELQDQAAYLAARRAGKTPDEAVEVANKVDTA